MMAEGGNNVGFFIGIDPSLTGTGVVVVDKEANIRSQYLLTTSSKTLMEKRMISLWDDVWEILYLYKSDNPVHIEGIAFAARGASIAEMAALNYYFRIRMTLNNVAFKVIPSTVLKKFITGKGNVKKEQMLLQVYKKFGVEFHDNNLCDAYCLCRMALCSTPTQATRRRTL
jgi:crossover junction endodeoxyribonuclease RuvC